jgi:hypothetical protein
MRITDGLCQFATHRYQTLISGPKHFLFEFIELGQVEVFFEAGKIAFFLFDLLFFHDASRCGTPGLWLVLCGRLVCLRLLNLRFLVCALFVLKLA